MILSISLFARHRCKQFPLFYSYEVGAIIIPISTNKENAPFLQTRKVQRGKCKESAQLRFSGLALKVMVFITRLCTSSFLTELLI